MYNFSKMPAQGSISVEDALNAGKWKIARPGRNILIAGLMLGIVLPCCNLSLWFLPLSVVAGIAGSSLYALWITPQWRIWAYAGVADIHQLQRSAELAGYLPKNSPMRPYGIMDKPQQAKLNQLQERFLTDIPFIDDPDIEDTSQICFIKLAHPFNDQEPQLTLGCFGITIAGRGFDAWKDILDEQVVFKSFSKMYAGTGADEPEGSKPFLTYYCGDNYISVPLADMDITVTRMDLLLNIYRGRYEQAVSSAFD